MVRRTSQFMLSKRPRNVALGFLVATVQYAAVAAEDAGGWHDTESVLSARAGYWSYNRHLEAKPDVGAMSLWGNLRARWGEHARVVADGWVRSDNLIERDGQGETRELYVRYATDDWDLRAGRQSIAWGKADGMNPTDTLARRDFSLLTPEDSDQRAGVTTVSAAMYTGDIRWGLYWQPEFRAHKLPLDDGAIMAYRDVVPQNPHQQFAARMERSGGGWDWSLSYSDIFDKNPDMRPGLAAGYPIVMELEHARVKVYGADAAGVVGGFGWRAEMAYTQTPDADGVDWFQKNSFFHLVAGVDRSDSEWFDINIQYVFRAIAHFQDTRLSPVPIQAFARSQALMTNQYDKYQHGLIARLHRAWWNDTLTAEISALAWAAHKDYLLRPKLIYAATDSLKLIAGADIYRGPRDSFLGNLRDLSLGYAEVQWNY